MTFFINFIFGFLLILTNTFHLDSFRTNLESKIYHNFFNQQIANEQKEIKTFPLLNEKNKFTFRPKSAVLVDLNNDYVVWEKNKNQKLPIASITKMMTALVLVKNNKLDEIITIPKKAVEIDGSKIPLQEGAKFKVRDLIEAMIILSANDTAMALEKHYSKNFNLIDEMNKEAQKLGLKKTFFRDAVGLSSENSSTAWELYLLTKEYLKSDFLREIALTPQTQICDLSGEFCYFLETTNRLLYAGFKGVKTGYTGDAGNCLVALKYINNQFPVVTIVLGAEDGHIRFEDVELSNQWLEQYAAY